MRWLLVVSLLCLGCAEEAPAEVAPSEAQAPPADPEVQAPEIEAPEIEVDDLEPPEVTEASGAFLAARHQRGLSLRDSDPAEAASLFEQACDHGFAPSCLALAAQLESGEGVDADPDRAQGLLEQACMDGSTMACDRLGH